MKMTENENKNKNKNNVIENGTDKVKVKRIKWSLDKEALTLSLEGKVLDLTETIYTELSLLDKYVYIYGIKQSCSDSGAGIKDFALRKDTVVKKFSLFINKDEGFLPQGRKALTELEKLEIKIKKVKALVSEMVQAGMKKNMAISISGKTFKLSEAEIESLSLSLED
jgi:hypothetical protein